MPKNGEQDVDRLGPLRMPLSTDDALRGAMQVPPPDDAKPKNKRKKAVKKRKAKRKKKAAS